MSPDERAGTDVRVLVAEVRDDLEAIDRLMQRLGTLRAKIIAASTPADPVDVMAAGAFLHHVYTAMETIHERIAAAIDGAVPSGERWHHEILTRMGVEIPGVRLAVLSPTTRAQLARLLRFRHFFRHAYRIDLLWLELAPLAADVDAIVSSYRDDVERFCTRLLATPLTP